MCLKVGFDKNHCIVFLPLAPYRSSWSPMRIPAAPQADRTIPKYCDEIVIENVSISQTIGVRNIGLIYWNTFSIYEIIMSAPTSFRGWSRFLAESAATIRLHVRAPRHPHKYKPELGEFTAAAFTLCSCGRGFTNQEICLPTSLHKECVNQKVSANVNLHTSKKTSLQRMHKDIS